MKYSATAKSGPSLMNKTFNAEDYPINIDFRADARSDSCLIFGPQCPLNVNYTASVYHNYATLNISHNSHSRGFIPSAFNSDPYLTSNFTLLGTSFDRNGVEFVTLVESLHELNLYWFASQFHPEKSQYEFDSAHDSNFPHSLKSIYSNQYLAEFFVNECKTRNNHIMATDAYLSNVIYNYNPLFVTKEMYPDCTYEQVYLFQ